MGLLRNLTLTLDANGSHRSRSDFAIGGTAFYPSFSADGRWSLCFG